MLDSPYQWNTGCLLYTSQKGLIGPSEGSKPRQVLISRQQWLEMSLNRPEEE